MSDIHVELTYAGALQIKSLIENRLEEIERLAAKHPNLPMRDPATVAVYEHTLKSLEKACEDFKAQTRLAERQRIYGLLPGEHSVHADRLTHNERKYGA
jgi:hypothetical protein